MIARSRIYAVSGLLLLVIGGWWLLRRESESEPLNKPTELSTALDVVNATTGNVRFTEPLTDSATRQGEFDLPHVKFSEIAALSGIRFTYHSDERYDRFLLPESMGGGAAWFDYDLDGWLDLFLANGCTIPVGSSDREHVQHLYRQTAPETFESVAPFAGLDFVAYAEGATTGDLDNDGFTDLAVTSFGATFLIHNNGDGTFASVLALVQADEPAWSTSAAFGDIDRDGDLDLYVAHYAFISLENNPVCRYDGPGGTKVRGYCGPISYRSQSDSLYRNEQGLNFTRVNTELLGSIEPEKGLGVVIADFDNDRWLDIYVANDMGPNLMFHNTRDEEQRIRFEEVGIVSGSALSVSGTAEASMGIACADFDDDHDLDIFISHYYQDKNTYYENHGKMLFEDRSLVSGLAGPSLPFLGFGTFPIDLDTNGSLDLFVTNGHVLGGLVEPYAMRPQLFYNNGAARFKEITSNVGPYFESEWVGRGAACADFDKDGDEDFVVSHIAGKPVALLRNDSPHKGPAIGFELLGTVNSRTAIGARVQVSMPGRSISRSIIGGGSYLSNSDYRILVGATADVSVVKIEVHWLSGRKDVWEDLEVGRNWLLCEGRKPFESDLFETP